MKIIHGLFFLPLIKTVQLAQIVDTTLILRSTITLDCRYSGNDTVLQIQWVKVNGSSEDSICTIDKRYGKYISEKYISRLSFIAENSTSALSVTLRGTSEADIGIYICHLVLFPSGPMKKVLAVQEDYFGHIVPSSHRAFRENSKILLHFLYTLIGDVNKVSVQRFTNEKMDLVTYCEDSKQGRKLQLYGFDYSKRSFVNCSDLQNILFIIHQAAITDEGLYQCCFWSDDKNQTISVKMHLQTTGITSISKYALMCGVSILVIVIFSIATLCLVRTQKKKRIQEKQVNVSFNSTYAQARIVKVDEEHTYANFVPNSSISKSWT